MHLLSGLRATEDDEGSHVGSGGRSLGRQERELIRSAPWRLLLPAVTREWLLRGRQAGSREGLACRRFDDKGKEMVEAIGAAAHWGGYSSAASASSISSVTSKASRAAKGLDGPSPVSVTGNGTGTGVDENRGRNGTPIDMRNRSMVSREATPRRHISQERTTAIHGVGGAGGSRSRSRFESGTSAASIESVPKAVPDLTGIPKPEAILAMRSRNEPALPPSPSPSPSLSDVVRSRRQGRSGNKPGNTPKSSSKPKPSRRSSLEDRLDGLRQTFPSRGPAVDHAA